MASAETDSMQPMYRVASGVTVFLKPWENFSEILATGEFTYLANRPGSNFLFTWILFCRIFSRDNRQYQQIHS